LRPPSEQPGPRASDHEPMSKSAAGPQGSFRNTGPTELSPAIGEQAATRPRLAGLVQGPRRAPDPRIVLGINRPFSARPYAVLPGARPVARLPRGRGWLPRKQPRSHQPDLVEIKCGYAGVLKHGEERPPRQARTGLDAQSPTSERGYGTSHQMRRRVVAQLVRAGGGAG